MIADPQAKIAALHDNIERVICGKSEAVTLAMVTLLARGHLLIEDVPGVGKTTLAHSFARSLNCSFKRIQFTSDLLPSDIIGLSVFNQHSREFEFRAGPVFANIVLADEINRTTPKTQSSLLEAMNDAQVSVENHTHPLPRPFMVIATQNPVEYQGTFPLPESQLDRFLIRLHMGYPDAEDEKRILTARRVVGRADEIGPVLTAEEVLALQEEAGRVTMDDALTDYLMAIVTATRSRPDLDLGVSTRGAVFLYRAAQAMALVEGRTYCLPDDVKRLVIPVFAHRIVVNPGIESFGRHTDDAKDILTEILEQVPVPL
ncbi:MAG: ATPase [Nitrospirae bacterium RIFCSPHIGHO2_01_FULL_66_17]|nr:MAG: ATPase [Nitrospirae bacterium RIFCSPHIGHO2_01_FULL_66_17]